MGTTACASPGGGTERKDRRHLLVPVLALLFQAVPPALLGGLAAAAYAEPRCLPEAWERPASLAVLALSAGVSLVLGSAGVYLLWTRSRPWTALLLTVACCVPALLGGAFYLHGLLVFLTLV